MNIAHISDLHIGYSPDQDLNVIQKLMEIRDYNVDHLIITGDLTNSGQEHEYEKVVRTLEDLDFLSGEKLTVIPGNHDLFTFFFSRFPQIESISKNLRKIPSTFAQLVNYKLCHYQNDLDIFYGRFEASFQNVVNLPGNRPGQYPFIKTLDRDVALIGLETNQLPQFPLNLFCSTGYLDPETTSEILERPELKDKIKIVLIHHHLQPGKEVALKVGRFSSASMGFVNKDEILVLLKKYQVDLVLHGHYHTNQSYSVDGLEVIGNGNPLCWSLIETIGDQYTVSHECERKKRSSHFLLQSLEETF